MLRLFLTCAEIDFFCLHKQQVGKLNNFCFVLTAMCHFCTSRRERRRRDFLVLDPRLNSLEIGRHIHHTLCDHGGERCMVINNQEILVHGYDPKTSTVYQFYRCKWHGCSCLGIANDRYHRTMEIENQICSLGYNVVSVSECSHPEMSTRQLIQKFVPYLHYIIYDFEVVIAKKDLSLSSDLTINSCDQ